MFCFLAGCSNLGHEFDGLQKPNADEVLIYYYRPSKFVGCGEFYDVKENGKKVTTLYNGGYFLHKTISEKKVITAKTETSSDLSFFPENGETYFVRGKIKIGALVGRPELELVEKEVALKELQNCKIIEQKNE